MSRVTGQARLAQIEARLVSAGENLSRQDAEALKRVAPDIARAIRAEAGTHMPKTGGYAATLMRDLAFDAVITIGKGMNITIFAKGRHRRRDLPAKERGVLRHPLFGNREHWYANRRGVKRGFVADGARRSEPLVVKAIKRARDKVARDIVR